MLLLCFYLLGFIHLLCEFFVWGIPGIGREWFCLLGISVSWFSISLSFFLVSFINLLLFTLCSLSSCFMFIGWLLIEASEEGWVLVYGWLCPFI
jgi:hypothetical protein